MTASCRVCRHKMTNPRVGHVNDPGGAEHLFIDCEKCAHRYLLDADGSFRNGAHLLEIHHDPCWVRGVHGKHYLQMPKYNGLEGSGIFVQLSRDQVKELAPGELIWFIAVSGDARRCHVAGKIKTWKRFPERIEIPLLYGARERCTFTQDEVHRLLRESTTEMPVNTELDSRSIARKTNLLTFTGSEFDPNRPDLYEFTDDIARSAKTAAAKRTNKGTPKGEKLKGSTTHSARGRLMGKKHQKLNRDPSAES